MSVPFVLAVLSGGSIFLLVVGLIIGFILLLAVLSRLRKCPSDKLMVIFGSTSLPGRKRSPSRCLHGGTAFIWPIIQDYGYLSLRPIQIEVCLRNALCKQNIRLCVPAVFTVGISIDEALMDNAANRLLGLTPDAIGELARDIIFGQFRQVVASMTIEQINSDRENFRRRIEQSVSPELNKLGLQLLHVNITDITDESGYIDALGRCAAAKVIHMANNAINGIEHGSNSADADPADRTPPPSREAVSRVVLSVAPLEPLGVSVPVVWNNYDIAMDTFDYCDSCLSVVSLGMMSDETPRPDGQIFNIDLRKY